MARALAPITVRTFLIWSVFALTCSSVSAQCLSPSFRAGQVREDSTTTVFATISISSSEFAPRQLVCLAATLKQRYPGRRNITVLVFDSPQAAEWFQGDIEVGDDHQGGYYRNLHALYVYDELKREEYVSLKPLGFHSEQPEDTRILLPVVGIPHCRLEVAGRCVLALEDATYAEGTYETRMTASRTLTGIVSPEGTITGVQVLDAHGLPSAPTIDLFARAAFNHLRTWRVEPGAREDSFRITYTFKIDPSLRRYTLDVQYALPGQITVRINP
jgi:hypothetical protein